MINGADLPPQSEAQQRSFFEAVLARALRAEQACGTLDVDLALVGTRIRIRFAGAMLRGALLPALAHRVVPAEEAADLLVPSLLIHVWESETSRVAAAPAPCPPTCFTGRGDIWTMLSRRVRSAYDFNERSLSLLDTAAQVGIFWTPAAAQLSPHVRGAPLRTLLHWWLEQQGAQLLKAAAVGTADGAILIAGGPGEGGAVGSTTAALASLGDGLLTGGGDHVAVTLEPEPTAHSLYRTTRIKAAGAGDLVFDPSSARSLTLKAAMIPRYGDHRETRIEPVPRAAMRDALSFGTLAQLPHAGPPTLHFIDRLLDRLPSYRLSTGSDPQQRAARLAAFLAAPPAPAPPAPAPAPAAQPHARPLVSVIIPVHNGAHFLADAVGSILAQQHRPLELIVVDDGSTDAIEAAVAALPVEARLLKQPNLGPAAARNHGLRHSNGEILAFLDADDLWPEGSLGARLAALAAPELAVATGHGQLVAREPESGEWLYVGDAPGSFPFYIGAALVRRSAFEQVGPFDESLRFAEDTDWFMRVRENRLRIERLDAITLLVRRHEDNVTFARDPRELMPLGLFRAAVARHRASPEGDVLSNAVDQLTIPKSRKTRASAQPLHSEPD